MTQAQARLVEAIRAAGDCAEYWPIVNDWVKDKGPAASLALRNINRTVDALQRAGIVTLDDEGYLHLKESAK